jgi:hypothetical protein
VNRLLLLIHAFNAGFTRFTASHGLACESRIHADLLNLADSRQSYVQPRFPRKFTPKSAQVSADSAKFQQILPDSRRFRRIASFSDSADSRIQQQPAIHAVNLANLPKSTVPLSNLAPSYPQWPLHRAPACTQHSATPATDSRSFLRIHANISDDSAVSCVSTPTFRMILQFLADSAVMWLLCAVSLSRAVPTAAVCGATCSHSMTHWLPEQPSIRGNRQESAKSARDETACNLNFPNSWNWH